MSRRRFVVVLAVFASACGGEPTDDTPAIPEWTVVEEMRIGSVDDPEQLLTQVQGVAIDANGNVYVGQPQDDVIRVFDATGARVRTIGGPGQGPGEFDRLSAIGLLGDTVWASDLTTRRVTFFTLAGEVISTAIIRPTVEPPFSAGAPFMLFADGTGVTSVGIPVGISGLDLRRVPYLRVDRTGQILDTIAGMSYEGRWGYVEGNQGERVPVTQTFDDSPVVAISRDGTRVAEIARRVPSAEGVASIRVTVTDAAGDTVFYAPYEYLPIPLDPAVADSAIALAVPARLRFFGSAAETEAAVRAAMRIPEYFLPITQAGYSETGLLWLKREELPDADQAWWVIDEVGNIAARVTLPMGLDVELIRADEIWGVQLDDLDVPYLVKYRIVRP